MQDSGVLAHRKHETSLPLSQQPLALLWPGSQGVHSSEGALRIIWSMACTGALLPDSRSQSALFTNCCRARERLPSKASETTYTVMCEPFGSS